MQKGFIFPSLYIYLGLGAVIGLVSLYAYVQTSRLEACKVSHKAYVSTVAEMGRLAEIKVKQIEAENKLKKEKADEDLRKLRIANGELSKRVRDNAGGSFLSSGEASTRIPESACINAGTVDEALRKFASGVTELIIEGQSAVDELNNAKLWAQ